MFKKICTVMVMIIFVFASATVPAQARTNNSDPVIAQSQLQDNVAVKLLLPAITATTSADLVKLSDITNFKHFNSTGSIELSQLQIDWTSNVAATTTLKFGLLASTTISGGSQDVYWFDDISFSTYTNISSTNGQQSAVIDYSPSVMKLGITAGAPTSFLTSDKSLMTNAFATSTKISSPVGLTSSGSLPGVGDLVMQVVRQEGTATTSVTAIYRVKPQY